MTYKPYNEKTRCIYDDCKYRSKTTSKSLNWKCDYLSITERSRIAWHIQHGLSDLPVDCRLYVPGERKAVRKELPATTLKSHDIYTTGKQRFHRYAIKEARKEKNS